MTSASLGLIEENDDELVAAEPHDRVGRPDAIDHAFGDGFQQLVARVVPQAVVDEFEIVEIDEQHRHPTVVALRIQHGLRQAVVEQGAVGKPGQRVMVGHEMNAVFGQLAFDRDAGDAGRDIDEAHLGVGRFARFLRIHREYAENRALMRQDRRRPA